MMSMFSPCFAVLDVIKSINELMKVRVEDIIHLTLGIGDPIWHDKKSRVSMVSSKCTFSLCLVLHLVTQDYEFLNLQDQRICGKTHLFIPH